MDNTPLKEEPLENEDLLQKILSRLSAKDFASAACVSKTWSKICDQILSRPKLTTALSLNPYLDFAVQEVLDKVLSEPVRPHFAIAFIGLNYNLQRTHRLITQKLPSQIPIITNTANGMIGMDARTNVIREAKWQLLEEDHVPSDFGGLCNLINQINNCGIVLVVGRVPGLKVEAIPLLQLEKKHGRVLHNPKAEMIDKFLTDIKEYTASVSNCTSPDAIIMFGDERINIKPVLLHLDNNMAKETVMVGDAGGLFKFESRDNSRNYPQDLYSTDAVALVFAKDNSSNVGGKIRFSVALSNGLVPFGPQLKVTSAVVDAAENITRLTARLPAHPEVFDIQELCRQIRAKEIHDKDLIIYVGVTHQKECSNGSQRSYLAYYEILNEAVFRIAVDGVGIKPGDSFVVYHTDCKTAFSSMINAYDDLKLLKAPAASTSRTGIINPVCNKNEVFGGLIFSSCTRCDSLRGLHVTESFPFSTNYPGTPVAGQFCNGEIARFSTNLISVDEGNGKGVESEGQDDGSSSGGCFLNYHSTVYLVMSYNPYR